MIGLLAHDLSFSGIGRLLLPDALRYEHDLAAAVAVVDGKSDAPGQFYARIAFEELLQTPCRVFVPLRAVRRLPTSVQVGSTQPAGKSEASSPEARCRQQPATARGLEQPARGLSRG